MKYRSNFFKDLTLTNKLVSNWMDNQYLQELIKETHYRGGGMILNVDNIPSIVVLTIEKYNQLTNMSASKQISHSPVQKISETASDLETNKSQKKVLVTGGAGYIGGHLVHELIKTGYEVVVLDNLSTGKRENIHSHATFIEGDLADTNLLKDIFASNQIEAVFHMAASLEVEESVKNPDKYIKNNLFNTVNLLSVMAEAGVKKIIFSSTAAVYGEQTQNPITENSALKPNNPYGSSKLLAERAIKFYSEYLGLEAVVFRYFNACGFNSEAKISPTHNSHLIYNVITVAKGEKSHLNVYGKDYETFDGTCIRDYVHVSDIVLPHILALEKMLNKSLPNNFEVINIGTGKGFSVEQVVNTTSEVLNKIIPMEIAPRRAGDAPVTVADNTKLLNILGYKLQHSSLENMIKTSWEVMKQL